MKIAITAQNPTPESPVDPRFGRAPWLMIYDPEKETWASVDNSTGINAAHGAGIQAAQKIVDQEARILITGAIGPKAFHSLTAAGIKVYHGATGTVLEAMQACTQGKLLEATSNDATGRV
ncbi:MAG: NifB/NifX family molybdenum-iron cluster-binding protein [Syntrophotaleaceae bacterium]